MSQTDTPRVAIVGGGVAGLTAGTYTARADFDTVVVDHGESILRRNAHLENVPGFPAGVNSRLFLDLLEEQAGRNGCLFEQGLVTDLQATDEGFRLRVESDEEFDLAADYVVVASWSDTDYLADVDGVGLLDRGSKTYVDVDECGRTGVDGLYAAGRIAEKPHQAVVAAGHGAEVAVALVDDSDVPYYHDWVAPEGYFTERGREVPPGCEEISEEERRRRERESIEVMSEAFAEQHPDEPTMHPSVVEKRERDE
ncbi:FAD-dependent oxidoreductase [Natronomonas marina]|uniref:FAD-dependent oxidoreductase n=1 Tax=Natronomonas marina TaxID=2961939 RepID=UPI0020CA0D95|nr:FAD-dependent oxidoreductase [Natronomonas marina]